MNAFPNAVQRFGMASLEANHGERAPHPPSPRPMQTWLDQPRSQPRRRRTVFRLWLPVTAIFWILAPLALLLAPLAWFAPRPYRPANPYLAVFAIGRLLTSLGGTVVHVDTADALVSIRLF